MMQENFLVRIYSSQFSFQLCITIYKCKISENVTATVAWSHEIHENRKLFFNFLFIKFNFKIGLKTWKLLRVCGVNLIVVQYKWIRQWVNHILSLSFEKKERDWVESSKPIEDISILIIATTFSFLFLWLGMHFNTFFNLHSAINEIFDFINSHQPMLSRVGFLQCFQFKIFIADFSPTDAIVTTWFSTFGVNLAKSIVA